MNWFSIILNEARSEVPNWQKEEEEYRLFKKALEGKPLPRSPQRSEFLQNMKDWTYHTHIEGADLSRGQAILQAKENFFNNEIGAPKFFEPQRTLRMGKITAEKDEDGWDVWIDFTAQFKKEARKRISPSTEELEELGFFLRSREPEAGRFVVELEVPHQGDMDLAMAIKAAGKDLKEKVSEFLQSPKMVNITGELDEARNIWTLQFTLEGKPLFEPEDEGIEGVQRA